MKIRKKPTAYVIIGFIGAGKTTFAKKLEKQTGALRFTKDEWMIAVFGRDPTFEGFKKYDEKMSKLAFEVALNCLKAGNDVIIDEGFWVRFQRDEVRKKIERAGGTAQFYYVKSSQKTMKARMLLRNQKLTKDGFIISQKMYEGYEKYFEEPSPDEKCIIIDNQGEA